MTILFKVLIIVALFKGYDAATAMDLIAEANAKLHKQVGDGGNYGIVYFCSKLLALLVTSVFECKYIH